MKNIERDVVIIGGGATGAGILRDCALRGIHAILLEKGDIAWGTTGRNHGLLHSGARYAVTDAPSAKECIKENRILKNIARHCVEDTGGLFLTLPDDSLEYQEKFIKSCHQANIDAKRLTPEQALQLEPSANPAMIGAVKVPDGSIDPFRLTASNILDAEEHGSEIMTYTEVTGLLKHQGRVTGVECINTKTGEKLAIHGQQVVNACGIWGQKIAEYADLSIKMMPSKGTLLIIDYRLNRMVLNRCRKPADADILVPGDTVSVIGTTSIKIPYDQIDNPPIDPEEVDLLIREGEKLAPALGRSRIVRAYAGVRPLVASDGESGRNVSRGIVLLDHQSLDNLPGFITIAGGKLMTYRLMAEETTNLIAKHLGNTAPCTTATEKLPGAEETTKPSSSLSRPLSGSAVYRHGQRANKFLSDTPEEKTIVCECEMVSRGEIDYAIKELNAISLEDLRRRTRLGMGPCQGEVCTCRAANILNRSKTIKEYDPINDIHDFLEERWKGNRPVLWGDTLRESEFSHWIYQSLLGYDTLKNTSETTAEQ
ncbi:Anaerobic glycerol-3-phosphate dehydrogenase subunit A [invertebrate metagenome]|uniref:glycerol-3-phosphate dehydrogenase n=1 Tax=invertebrate metagenome TaxID=1711999 RepID=A0A2H9T8M7_9ZZZZ